MDAKKLAIGAAAALLTVGAVGAAGQSAVGSGESESDEGGPSIQSLLQSAKIDRQVAEKAALSAVPGEARDVELESENGSAAYEVEVAGNDSKLYEVTVDAVNGKVLGQETEEGED